MCECECQVFFTLHKLSRQLTLWFQIPGFVNTKTFTPRVNGGGICTFLGKAVLIDEVGIDFVAFSAGDPDDGINGVSAIAAAFTTGRYHSKWTFSFLFLRYHALSLQVGGTHST